MIIILNGLLGSGKSYFTKLPSEEFLIFDENEEKILECLKEKKKTFFINNMVL